MQANRNYNTTPFRRPPLFQMINSQHWRGKLFAPNLPLYSVTFGIDAKASPP